MGIDEKVAEESGEGVLVNVASRSIDKFEPPSVSANLFSLLKSEANVEEEKYYEVFADVSDDDVDEVQVRVEVGGKFTEYAAEKGHFTAKDTEYNWKLSVPYAELGLEGTDGKISSDIIALKKAPKLEDGPNSNDKSSADPESKASDNECAGTGNKQDNESYGLIRKNGTDLNRLATFKKTDAPEIDSKDMNQNVVGTASILASTASGVYNVAKTYLGSDFSILETNTSTTQVYYVYGTVYSSAYQYHKIWDVSINGKNFSNLTISSYDGSQATVRLRNNSTENPGTWLCIYGKMTLNNLNIIGTGTGDSLGLVSAKNTSDKLTASEGESSIYATNCTFSNNSKWAVHGDRNAYLNVDHCTIKNSQGGVGCHGQINVTNSNLDNTGGSFSGKAGVQLNIQINQTGFKHSANLQNNTIKGFSMGVEYAISKYWPNNQIGGTYGTVTLTTTGSGNTIANCPVGIDINKYSGLTNYMHITLGSVFSQVYGCTTGVLNTESHDTFNISGGAFRNNTRAINNAYTINFTGGSIYSNSSGSNSGAGVYNSSTGTFNMSGGSIYSNSTAANGGGIYNAGICTITSGEIRNNTSGGNGAGIANTGTLSLSGASIYSNTASGSGGGIYNTGSTSLSSASLASIMSDNTEIASDGDLKVLNDTQSIKPLSDNKSVKLYNNISAKAVTNVARIGTKYYSSLQDAVNSASSGATIYLLNNYTVSSTVLIINKNLAIYPESSNVTLTCNTGTWGVHIQNSKVTLGGNGDYTLSFDGNKQQIKDSEGIIGISGNGSVVSLHSGLRIINSSQNGFVCGAGNTINVNSGSQFFNNGKSGVVCAGGANITGGNFYKNGQDGITMLANDGTKLNVTGGSFYNNGRAGIAFGAIDPTSKDIVCYATLSKGEIYGNGVGLYLNTSNKNYWNVSNTGMSIHDNTNRSTTQSVAGMGGGIHVSTKSVLAVTGGSIYSNSASGSGGGIYNSGTLTLTNGTISGNQTAGSGGGVANTGTFIHNGGSITGNKQTTTNGNGGGVFNSGTYNLKGGTVSNNTSARHGGGIRNDKTFNMTSGTISGNVATNNGGGVFSGANTTTNITGGIITNNTSLAGGGIAMDTTTSQQTIKNATISNNKATSYGGGIWSGADLLLSGNTVSSNSSGNGGGVYSSGPLTVQSGNINNNTATANNGGAIYLDAGTGNITGGTITGNKAVNDCGGGIFVNISSKLNIKGGTISSNSAKWGGGVFNQYGGNTNMTGGVITQNYASDRGGGLFNKSSGTTKGIISLTGGTISANTSTNTGSGVVVQSTTNVGGAVNIKSDNNVALFDGNYLNITSALTGSTPILVVPNSYSSGSKIAEVAYGTKLGSLMFSRFDLVDANGFIIRPGDYVNAASGVKATDIVVSSKYTVHYDKNTTETVTNIPAAGTKYWYEGYTIPSAQPAWMYRRFKGWNEDKTVSTGTYQASGNIDAAVNKNLVLYAIWDSTVAVKYTGNKADSGTEKSENVTYETAAANGGYGIRSNAGYANFARKDYKFVGWSSISSTLPSKTEYSENGGDKISYEDIYGLITKQGTAGEHPPFMTLYAVWDKIPAIKTVDKEYYEGETINRDDLLKDITAKDAEDGNLTSKLKIVKIAYSEGKVDGDNKKAAYTESWPMGMPEESTLDTWFLKLDKKDGSVTHTVTYEVADSAGSIVTKEAKITVKYNEFPTIEAEDRYYTLEEAQTGAITEDELLKNAIAENKLYGKDIEEGEISDKIKLINFHPEEMAAFTDSGYVSVTYHVQDSMGPEKKGKETTKQIKVNIIKDGEKTETSPVQIKYIRFINRDNYYKNADVNADALSPAEKKEKNVNGGLCVDSRWYSNELYRRLITSLWETSSSKEVWRFIPEDVIEVKRYIEDYGIGNSKSQTALNEFVSRFQELKN